MATTLSAWRIFIASPGGLDEERKIIRDTINYFNESRAFDEGVVFIPSGWELVPGALGRPQAEINAELHKSDFMILLLWDRWGSPTGSQEAFTSGTQEEFHVALQCIGEPTSPMRDLLVLFKAVDERQLRDPGPQLSRVLDFKSSLEHSREVLFHTVDSLEDIRLRVEQNLKKWTHLGGEKAAKSITISPIDASLQSLGSLRIQDLIAKADELESTGMITQAEAAYAQAVSSDDAECLLKYARFMRRTGRLDGAYRINERLLSLPRFIASSAPEIVAQRADVIANMGLIRRKQGLLRDSRVLLQEAVQTARSCGLLGRKELGYALDNLGLTLLRIGDVSGSRASHEEALQVRRMAGDRRGEAHSLISLARIAKQAGNLESAARQAEEAMALLELEKDEPGIANASSLLGEILVSRGSLAMARARFETTLNINERRRNSDGVSVASAQLARISLETGDLESANTFAQRSREESIRSSNQEGTAISLRLLGQIKHQEGDLSQSLDCLMQAISLFAKMGDLTREADSRLDAAKTLVKLGQRAKAENELTQAMKAVAKTNNNVLAEKIKRYAQDLK